jgi:hypothetical protein
MRAAFSAALLKFFVYSAAVGTSSRSCMHISPLDPPMITVFGWKSLEVGFDDYLDSGTVENAVQIRPADSLRHLDKVMETEGGVHDLSTPDHRLRNLQSFRTSLDRRVSGKGHFPRYFPSKDSPTSSSLFFQRASAFFRSSAYARTPSLSSPSVTLSGTTSLAWQFSQ